MSLYTNLSVPTKVLHLCFILPSFLRKEDIEDISFLYTDVPFDNIVWIRAGNIQKPPISLAHTRDPRYTMADIDKPF